MGFSQAQIAIIVFISTCIFIQSGFAIKCWECRSDVDPKCADTFDNTTFALTDCNHLRELGPLPGIKPTVCRKIRQKENGRQVVFRSCEWLRSSDDQVGECSANTFNTPSNSKVEFCETCGFDGCNSAEGLHTTVLWKALILVCIGLFMLH